MRRPSVLAGALLAGLVWRVFLALPVAHWGAASVSFLLGLAPYATAVAFVSATRARTVALVAAVGALLADVIVASAALRSTSSTAGVALLLEPLAATFIMSTALSAIALCRRWLRFRGSE